MNAPAQKKWRDCKQCGTGFVQLTSEAPAKLCPKCRRGDGQSNWEKADDYAPDPTKSLRPKWTIESARAELARREALKTGGKP